jgi:hypothetical protein
MSCDVIQVAGPQGKTEGSSISSTFQSTPWHVDDYEQMAVVLSSEMLIARTSSLSGSKMRSDSPELYDFGPSEPCRVCPGPNRLRPETVPLGVG